MIKLNTSYSKKVPVPGEDYSSQSFHCSIEVELSDKLEAGELRARIHETFAQCRTAVEAELHGGVPATRPAQPVAAPPPVRVLPQPPPREPAGAERVAVKASNRQIKYILDLAKAQGLGLSEVNTRCQDQFGVGSVYALDRKAASRFVDELKAAA